MTQSTELALLQQRVEALEDELHNVEQQLSAERAARISMQNSLRVGKGVFIGVTFTLGFFTIALFDRLRDLLLKHVF